MMSAGLSTYLRLPFLGLLCLSFLPSLAASEVTGKVLVVPTGKAATDPSGVVISLIPVDPGHAARLKRPPIHAALVQKNKTFSPHLLVVPPGSTVDFPNRDPFFHNVFSLFEGKKFDLGLYESGTSRSVKFDRPGVSYIFCNIHPQMNAIVISLNTPYYAVADKTGAIRITGVDSGEYVMQVWAEGLNSDEMQRLSRRVSVSQDVVELGSIQVPSFESLAAHKNKYGRDYETNSTGSGSYEPR
jgi:hypothetical protein